jgi:hypothetical protein
VLSIQGRSGPVRNALTWVGATGFEPVTPRL